MSFLVKTIHQADERDRDTERDRDLNGRGKGTSTCESIQMQKGPFKNKRGLPSGKYEVTEIGWSWIVNGLMYHDGRLKYDSFYLTERGSFKVLFCYTLLLAKLYC